MELTTSSRSRPATALGFTLVEVLVVITIVSLLLSLLLPAVGKARELSVVSKCLANQRQSMVVLSAYGADCGQYPSLLDWSVLDAQDMPLNRVNNIADNDGAFSIQCTYNMNSCGIPSWVLTKNMGYYSDYRMAQCATPLDPTRPIYDRQVSAVTTAKGFFFSYLSPDTSLYTIYENGSGTSLAYRVHSDNPFDLFTDINHARSTSERGLSYREMVHGKYSPSRYSWIACPGRFESTSWNDPRYPGNTYGGYAYEPHGSQPYSSVDPVWAGSPWADYWSVNNVHVVDRVVGFADGHALYDHRLTNHVSGGCPEPQTPGQ